jgi:Ca-activated chloride channel family protein
MKKKSAAGAIALSIAGVLASLAAQPAPAPTIPKDQEDEVILLSSFQIGATPGGVKDIAYFRSQLEDGELPPHDSLLIEGLLSQHDLPVAKPADTSGLLALSGEALTAQLSQRPEVRYLAQLGLSSTLDARTWKRAPLNLVAVVDQSGSMSDHIELVKTCLLQIAAQLGPDDQLGIVLYGEDAHIHLAPTPAGPKKRAALEKSIHAIEINGSTNMERGLKLGYEVAAKSQPRFKGMTRLMQFTDEQPNTGNTSTESFIGLAEAGSHNNIGLTTIGVGRAFGVELMNRLSSVRGGNAFYFADETEMKRVFTEEFDTLVTELAHELDLIVRPAPGLKLAGVYGVPGDILSWLNDRDLVMRVSSVFASKRKGGIYFVFAADPASASTQQPPLTASLATVQLAYIPAGSKEPRRSSLTLQLQPDHATGTGLLKGQVLIDAFLALKGALWACHVEQNPTLALERAHTALTLLNAGGDTFAQEQKDATRLIELLENSLAEKPAPENSPADKTDPALKQRVMGVWKIVSAKNEPHLAGDVVVFRPDSLMTHYEYDEDSHNALKKRRSVDYRWDNGRIVVKGEAATCRFEDSDNLHLEGFEGDEAVHLRRAPASTLPLAEFFIDPFTGLPPASERVR